mmetsp:Transcript_93980/g.303538  ORF Transcript_93980/g.303538 Transcript_93980/m.303538 type:complete len:204 (-) Transcript_93980:1203-1814(-)
MLTDLPCIPAHLQSFLGGTPVEVQIRQSLPGLRLPNRILEDLVDLLRLFQAVLGILVSPWVGHLELGTHYQCVRLARLVVHLLVDADGLVHDVHGPQDASLAVGQLHPREQGLGLLPLPAHRLVSLPLVHQDCHRLLVVAHVLVNVGQYLQRGRQAPHIPEVSQQRTSIQCRVEGLLKLMKPFMHLRHQLECTRLTFHVLGYP